MSFLKKFFHAPSFLYLSSAGVDISNHAITYIAFDRSGSVLRIDREGRVPLAPDVYKDGVILQRDALVKALGEVRRRLPTSFVKVSIPEETSYIFSVRIPYEARSSIEEQILFKLEENVPLKVSEVRMTYDIIKEPRARDGDDILVVVSVVPKKVTDELASVCAAAGLSVISFGIEPKMLAKSVVTKRDHRALMIVHIKEYSTSMTYVADGIARFASTVAMGNAAIREGIMKINPKLYNEQGIFVGTAATFDAESFYSLLNVFSVMKEEIKKFAAYVGTQAEKHDTSISEEIDEVIIVGDAAAIPGLASHIGQNLKMNVVLGNVWTNAFDVNRDIPTVSFARSLGEAVAVGCALPSFKK